MSPYYAGLNKHFDSGSQTRACSTQAACFELAGRGIGSLTHSRLAIGVGLEAIDLETAVRQPSGRQDGDRQTAGATEETEDGDAFAAGCGGVTKIEAMPMGSAPASPWTRRSLALETVVANLDRREKPESVRKRNPELFTGPRCLLHGPVRRRQPSPPTNLSAPLHYCAGLNKGLGPQALAR